MNEVVVSLADDAVLDVVLDASDETVVKAHCLLLLRCTWHVVVDVTPPEVVIKVVGVSLDYCFHCHRRERIGTLRIYAEYCLTVVVDIVSALKPGEFSCQNTLLEESDCAVHGRVHVLTASSATLADEHVHCALVLDSANSLDAESLHLLGISKSRTLYYTCEYLISHFLKCADTNKVFRCCHSLV